MLALGGLGGACSPSHRRWSPALLGPPVRYVRTGVGSSSPPIFR